MVQLDGAYRLATLKPVLQKLVESAAQNQDVGIGIVSMLGFQETAKSLKVWLCIT